MHEISKGMSSLKEGEVSQQLGSLLEATYMRLIHEYGPSVNENDLFHAAFVHTTCSKAFEIWADSGVASHDSYDRMVVARDNTAMKFIAPIVHKRSGYPLAHIRKLLRGVLDQFLRGEYPNPFESGLQLNKGVESALITYFSGDKRGGVDGLVQIASRGYRLFLDGNEPSSPTGEYRIDDSWGARLVYALLLQMLPELNRRDTERQLSQIPQRAVEVACIIGAAMYARLPVAERDADYHIGNAVLQMGLRLVYDLIRDDATAELRFLREHANMADRDEARIMVLSLLANHQRLAAVIDALGRVQDHEDSFFPDVPLDLVEAVSRVAEQYRQEEEKARRVKQ